MKPEYLQHLEELLTQSVQFHGHLCAGQVIGVRMSMLALRLLGIEDPRGADRKKLYVVVEIDRCATDAIQSVTGCSLGKRTMRWVDFGIMAATFADLSSSRAVRITALEEAREKAKSYYPEIGDRYEQQLHAYKVMPDHELFKVQEVSLVIPEENMPGRPVSKRVCEACGDFVQDRREIERDGRTICRACDSQRYYRLLS